MKRRDAERLLRDLANNTGPFLDRYPLLFVGDSDPEQTATVLRQLLRRAWRARDYRRREWWCHEIEAYYHKARPDRDLKEQIGPRMTEAVLGEYAQPGSLLFALREPPRTVSALETALLYFKKNSSRAHHCPTVECPAPYFFASKKNQKYCSENCAKPAQRAYKRKWWRKNRGQ